MKKIALLAAGLLTAASLTACAETDPGQNVPGCDNSGCEVTIMYKGQPLNCVSWDGSHSEIGLSCDFVEYHGLTGATTVN